MPFPPLWTLAPRNPGPSKPFLPDLALVVTFYHSNRRVTSAVYWSRHIGPAVCRNSVLLYNYSVHLKLFQNSSIWKAIKSTSFFECEGEITKAAHPHWDDCWGDEREAANHFSCWSLLWHFSSDFTPLPTSELFLFLPKLFLLFVKLLWLLYLRWNVVSLLPGY